MIEEYRGIYFQKRDYKSPQKKFYEHGAHFEYKALYIILEEITKKIKPKITSSLPKKKNVSLKRKKASSYKKKKNIKIITKKNKEEIQNNKLYNIKVNLSHFNPIKEKYKKEYLNNSLIIHQKGRQNFSCERVYRQNGNKNFSSEKCFQKVEDNFSLNNSNKSSKIISLNNTTKNKNSNNFNIIKKNKKYNSNIINNSLENYINININNINNAYNKLILGEYINNTNKKNNNSKMNHSLVENINPISLNNNSKKNKKIIFSYNNNYKKVNNLGKKYGNKNILNKLTKKQKYLMDKNNDTNTKINKSELINDHINNSFYNNLINKNKINISNIKINLIKSGKNNQNVNKSKNNIDYENNSFQIKTPKYNYMKNIKTNKKKKIIKIFNASSNNNSNKCKKSSKQLITQNVNKFIINENIKINDQINLSNQSRQLKTQKKHLSRNNDNINEEKSFFNYYNIRDKNSQSPFRNFFNNSLIIKNKENTLDKIGNIEISNLIDEKEREREIENNKIKKKYLFVNRNSVEKKDMKKYIKNKLLQLHKIINEQNMDNNEKYEQKSININMNQNYKINTEKRTNNEENKNIEKKYVINFNSFKKGDYIFNGFSGKSNNDSINKSKSNKNGDKKSIISTNLTSNINSKGIIIPLYQKRIDNNNS